MKRIDNAVIKNLITKGEAKIIKSHLDLIGKEAIIREGMGKILNYGHHPTLDLFLDILTPVIEKKTNEKLVPTYNFSRKYFTDSYCYKHKDRGSCVWTCSLSIHSGEIKSAIGYVIDDQDIEIEQNVGDLLILRGSEITHWRTKVKSETTQLFLHYVPDSPEYKEFFYDGKEKLSINLEESGLIDVESGESRESVGFKVLKNRFFEAFSSSFEQGKKSLKENV